MDNSFPHIMQIRILLPLCSLIVSSSCAERFYYNTQFDTSSQDQSAEKSENVGFVKPIDFSAYTQQFLGGNQHLVDFFASESKTSNFFQPFNQEKQSNNTGFVQPLQFASSFNNKETLKTFQPRRSGSKKFEEAAGKTSHLKNSNPNTQAIYADSADVEVFYPKEKAILPTDHLGRPKPYDGYRDISDAYYTEETNPTRYKTRIPLKRVEKEEEEEEEEGGEEAEERKGEANEEDDEEEERAEESPKTGIKYQYDESVHVPDLIIKRYPYEKTIQAGDDDFIADYSNYHEKLPSDLEKHFGMPDWLRNVNNEPKVTENLAENRNCQRVESREQVDKREKRNVEGQICYNCRDPKTGDSYEQCAYETSLNPKKYYYTGSTSSKSAQVVEPQSYRHKRSLGMPSFDHFIFNDDSASFLRRPREEESKRKRKTKKYKSNLKKKNASKRKSRQQPEDPSAYLENPPESYSGESQFGGFYSLPYEVISSDYEGPNHDDYYDRTDDRIPNESSYAPLVDYGLSNQKRTRRKPDFEFEYKGDYRFGPEYFEEQPLEVKEPEEAPTNEAFFKGNVKIFKNGDVCEKRKKENMLCMVCNNDKTGAVYEQCQYASKPNAKQYSYGQQKSYSSDRPQRHALFNASPDNGKKVSIMKIETKTFKQGSDGGDISGAPSEESETTVEAPGDEEQEGERIEARDGIEGLEEFMQGERKPYEDNFPSPDESYDQYFKRVFPEFERYGSVTPPDFNPFLELEKFRENEPEQFEDEESKHSEKFVRVKDEKVRIPRDFYPDEEESKKDLEKALGEFKQRDWSKCKKIEKDKLICYQCVNEEGVKNEECMFVEGSSPQSSHLAYHEKKDFVPTTTLTPSFLSSSSTMASPKNVAESKKSELIEEAPDATAAETQKNKGDFEKISKLGLHITENPIKKYKANKENGKNKTETVIK